MAAALSRAAMQAYQRASDAYQRAIDAEPAINIDNVSYSTEEYEGAASKFLDAPRELTDRDIAQLAVVSSKLGREAAILRRGHERPALDGTHNVPLSEFLDYIRSETIFRASYRYRILQAHARIRELEKRIGQLEQRPQMEFRGTWAADVKYRRGDVVTFSGCAWIAKGDSVSVRPEFDSAVSHTAWALLVKKGRDAK